MLIRPFVAAFAAALLALPASAQDAPLKGTWLEYHRGSDASSPMQVFQVGDSLLLSYAGSGAPARIIGNRIVRRDPPGEAILSGTTRMDWKDGTVSYKIPDLKGSWRGIQANGQQDAVLATIGQDRERVFLNNGAGQNTSRVRGALVRDQIVVDDWQVKGYLSSPDVIRWSNGTRWVREVPGATSTTTAAPVAPAASQAPAATGGANAVVPNIAGAWASYGSDGGGSGGFASADIVIQQSGEGFAADFTDIDMSAPAGTPGKQHRVTGMVGPAGVRLSGQNQLARFEDNGAIIRFADGSFWRRKPAGAPSAAGRVSAPTAAAPSAAPPASNAAPNPVLLGRVVRLVAAGPLGGGAAISTFVMFRAGTWAERTPGSGENRFTFNEVARDDWSVYLRDDSRNVSIQLDLFQRKVYYTEGNGPRQELYAIVAHR
jgi:hypothetical protein